MRLEDFRRTGYRVPCRETCHGRTHLCDGRQPSAQPSERPSRLCHRRPARPGSVSDVSDGDVLLIFFNQKAGAVKMLHQLIYYITETTSQPLPETIFQFQPFISYLSRLYRIYPVYRNYMYRTAFSGLNIPFFHLSTLE